MEISDIAKKFGLSKFKYAFCEAGELHRPANIQFDIQSKNSYKKIEKIWAENCNAPLPENKERHPVTEGSSAGGRSTSQQQQHLSAAAPVGKSVRGRSSSVGGGSSSAGGGSSTLQGGSNFGGEDGAEGRKE